MANLRKLLALAEQHDGDDAEKVKRRQRTEQSLEPAVLPRLQRRKAAEDEGPSRRQEYGAPEYQQPLVVWDEYSSSKMTPTRSGKPAAGGAAGEGENAAPMDKQEAVNAINNYLKILSKSEAGRALVKMAEEMDIRFAVDTQAGVYGYYSPTENLVAVNPKVDEGRVVATLAHELRHAWQFKQGFHTKIEHSPRDNIWMMRAMEADAEANSLRVCAELAEAGYPEALQSHVQSEYGDEAMAFMHQVQQDPESLKNGKAQRAAFDQWFAKNWRRNAYDKHSADYLEHFLFAIDHTKKTKGFTPMTAKWLEGLGEQPDGKNYLKGKGAMLLDDDFYKEGVTRDIEERLEHIERRLTAKRKDGDAPLQFPTGRARRPGGGRAASNDDLPIAAEVAAADDYEGKQPPRLIRHRRTTGSAPQPGMRRGM